MADLETDRIGAAVDGPVPRGIRVMEDAEERLMPRPQREPVGSQRRGEHQTRLALLEGVRGRVALTGLEPGIGKLGEPERLPVIERRLLRVADPQLDVVDALQA